MVGYFAEAQILGGTILFDRGDSDLDVNLLSWVLSVVQAIAWLPVLLDLLHPHLTVAALA